MIPEPRKGRGAFSSLPARREGKAREGSTPRRQPPTANAAAERADRAAGLRKSGARGSPTPAAGEQRARGESGARGAGRPALYSHGWRPAAGTRTQLAVFRGRNIHGAEERPSSSPLSLTARARLGAESGVRPEAEGLPKAGLRRHPLSPGCSRSPAAAREERGGHARGARARTQRNRAPFGRRGTHRLLPSAARPSSFSCPLPSRPGTHGPRNGDAARPTRTRESPPAPGAALAALPARARAPPSCPPLGATPAVARAGRHADREVGEKVACPLGAREGPRKTRHVPWLPFWVWGLRFKRPSPTGGVDEKEGLKTG